MSETTKEGPQTALVLCHTFFHTAFRPQIEDIKDVDVWKANQFLANFIIEMGAEKPGHCIAFTTNKIFEEFSKKLIEEKKSPRIYEMVGIISNLVYQAGSPEINKLKNEEGALAMADKLYSASRYDPILVTNMVDGMKEEANKFYEGKEPPFNIRSPESTNYILEGRYSYLHALVNKRMASKIGIA